jgi:hypothetical protein
MGRWRLAADEAQAILPKTSALPQMWVCAGHEAAVHHLCGTRGVGTVGLG